MQKGSGSGTFESGAIMRRAFFGTAAASLARQSHFQVSRIQRTTFQESPAARRSMSATLGSNAPVAMHSAIWTSRSW
eukprot:31023-Prymnesium_polylepis.1